METFEMVKVTDILRNAKSSVDFGRFPKDSEENAAFWEKIIANKSSDSGFIYLVNSILDNGFSSDSAIGWCNGDTITEGHHRLVAAILLGLDEVPVCEDGADDNRDICSHHGCCGEGDWDAPEPSRVSFLIN